MLLESFISAIQGWLQIVSESVGSGNLTQDLILIGLLAIVACLLILFTFLIFRSRPEAEVEATDRLTGVMGRLEKIEGNMNTFKTDVLRTLEFLKVDIGYIREVTNQARTASEIYTSDEEGVLQPIEDDISLEDAKKKKTEDHFHIDNIDTSVEEIPSLQVEEEVDEIFVQPLDEELPTSEEEPENLTKKLKKSRLGLFEKIKSVFATKSKIDEEALEELEAQLVSVDLGVKTVNVLIDEVKSDLKEGRDVSQEALLSTLKIKVLNILEKDLSVQSAIAPVRQEDGPLVIMVVGVNGVGKTTTVAKLASSWKQEGASVLMVAADTFRAAAVDQLKHWGEKVDVPVVFGAENAKPQTVVFEAMERAASEYYDVIIIDTAGRLHTKSNLMQELEGVKNIIVKHQPSAPHETILVLDGSTGQNAIQQAREFNDSVKLTGIIITKLDGTPKGGIVVAIKNDLGIPVRYIGVGESEADLRPFDARDFTEALFSTDELNSDSESVSAHGETRRRRRRRETSAYIEPYKE